MNKRIPKPKEDRDLENFIEEGEEEQPKETGVKKESNKNKDEEPIRIKKSLEIRTKIDEAIKLESIKTKQKQYAVIDKALTEYLKKRGYKDL